MCKYVFSSLSLSVVCCAAGARGASGSDSGRVCKIVTVWKPDAHIVYEELICKNSWPQFLWSFRHICILHSSSYQSNFFWILTPNHFDWCHWECTAKKQTLYFAKEIFICCWQVFTETSDEGRDTEAKSLMKTLWEFTACWRRSPLSWLSIWSPAASHTIRFTPNYHRWYLVSSAIFHNWINESSAAQLHNQNLCDSRRNDFKPKNHHLCSGTFTHEFIALNLYMTKQARPLNVIPVWLYTLVHQSPWPAGWFWWR